jgi:tRNA dimethylallyltransferase
MVEGGLVAEVRGLLAAEGGLSRTAGQALGYREVMAYLRDETTLEMAVAETVRRTRAFARRQRMWWRRDPRIAWFGTSEQPRAVVGALLRDWEEP